MRKAVLYIVSQTSDTKRHLIGVVELVLSWQLFTVIIATAGVAMPLLSNHIVVVIVSQWQQFGGDLHVTDAAEEIGDGRFVEVSVKQISSDSHVANTLPRWTDLHSHSRTEQISEWESKVQRPTRHITSHFRDGPPGNHLHSCTGTDNNKLTAKSIKPTQKKTQNTIIYYLHTHAHKRNTN